jgi:hypothetical protein
MISYSLVSIGSHTAETRPCCKTRRNEPLENLCTQESKAQSLQKETETGRSWQGRADDISEIQGWLLWMCWTVWKFELLPNVFQCISHSFTLLHQHRLAVARSQVERIEWQNQNLAEELEEKHQSNDETEYVKNCENICDIICVSMTCLWHFYKSIRYQYNVNRMSIPSGHLVRRSFGVCCVSLRFADSPSLFCLRVVVFWSWLPATCLVFFRRSIRCYCATYSLQKLRVPSTR